MATDFEALYDIEDLSDDELRQLILQKVAEAPGLDAGFVEVEVEDGAVTVGGRVGTEEEYQQVEQILNDELGIDDFENNLLVDETVRDQLPEPADEAAAEAREEDDELGGTSLRTEPSAEHLSPDTQGELYGTHDLGKAIERGESYEAPDHPPQMGSESREQH